MFPGSRNQRRLKSRGLKPLNNDTCVAYIVETEEQLRVGRAARALLHPQRASGEGAAEASASEMRVPVKMMDKAFKKAGRKASKYRDDGEATLRMAKVVGGVAQTVQPWAMPIDLGQAWQNEE